MLANGERVVDLVSQRVLPEPQPADTTLLSAPG
jgi:hypothetical protein